MDYPITHVEIKQNAGAPKKQLLMFEELKFGKYCDFIELETAIKALEAEKIANKKYGRRDRHGLNSSLYSKKSKMRYYKLEV